MGLSHSPKISTSGLVFCLDTANQRSYPGSGAVWSDLSGNSLNATGNASNISSLGVTSGALLDPLRAMDLAQNDPEQLQKEIITISTNFINKEQEMTMLLFFQKF
jgi:hypothetical protein